MVLVVVDLQGLLANEGLQRVVGVRERGKLNGLNKGKEEGKGVSKTILFMQRTAQKGGQQSV